MTFPRQISLLAFLAFLGLVLTGCQPSDPDSPNVKQLTSIAVTPNPVNMEIGGFRSLTVTGTLEDNSTYVVNFGTTFASSATGVASVTADTGYITALSAGSATITATHTASGLTATTTVVVSPLRAVSIDVAPATSTLAVGSAQSLVVTATYNNGTAGNVTADSTFVSSDPTVATVGASGVVSAVALGDAVITVTHTPSGNTDSAAVTVGNGGGGAAPLISFDEVPPPRLTDFGTNGEGAVIASDPAGGANKVLQVFKYALPLPGSEQWAGTTISTIFSADPADAGSIPAIPFSDSAKTMTVRVWSHAVGVRVRLKVENASNPGISVETDAITTTSGEWETLTFDFANPGLSPPVGGGPTSPLDLTKTYNRLSIFMDFGVGNGGSGPLPEDRVYYVDDITFVGGGGGGGSGSTGTCTAPNCTDFSSGGIGFGVFENPGGGTVEVAADPNDATNDVVKFVKTTGDNDYFGTTITGLAGPAELLATNKTVTLRVYSPTVGTNFLLKLEGGPDGAVVEKDMVTTVAGAWETLSFDLSAGPTGTYATVVIFPNGRSKVTTDKTMYIDELKFPAAGGGGGATAPTDAPTTIIPADALTIYSDAASIAGLNPFPFWGQDPPVTSSEETIAGNKSLKYVWAGPGGLYQGIDWESNPVDVSAKGKLHIDFWTPNVASVKVSIISPGLENPYTQVLTTGGWNSVDIDLSNYSVPNLANIIQIKLEPSSAGTLYVDNIFFWGTGSGSADCTGGTFTGGVFAADYRGSLNPADGKPPLTTLCGDIGFFYDARFPATAQFEFGGIANQVVNPGGINNFYYGFGLTLPAITDGYFGAYVNAPANGIANVSSFTNLRFTLWGPAELFEKSFTPQIQVVMAGPVVSGCGSNSGRSEIQAPLVNGQKIGAASNFVVPLNTFTLKFACSGETTVAEVLAKVAQVNFSLIGTNIQYSVPDTSTPPAYSNGLNVGPISFN